MAVKREKVHFETVEELLGAPVEKDATTEIRIDQIYPFENHPFKVLDDDKMEELVESIKENGVLSPVLVRPDDEGGYEMISGHRRMHAAKLAGLTTIPAIIKPMTNDEATIVMVDSNMQREEILPSERAFALKMKLDAMRRQGSRVDLTSGPDVQSMNLTETSRHDVEKSRESWSSEAVGRSMGMGGRQVQRYIRLTELIPELLDYVDRRRLPMILGVEISYFNKVLQKWLYQYIRENGMVRQAQIDAIKKNNVDNLTQYSMIEVLNAALPQKKQNGKLTFSKRKLDRFFTADYDNEEREKVILQLLEKWKENGEHGI
ncbi:ParB/RepB/Spo0J family partition protein [Bilifractor sp. LCP21S3_A7]|jgi:ParB family chromosome partitioning protein|uniref:ParB/RepB/Spo0J family partition protein n=1 Tax=Bilifractor sp. LCP21S3_A7 TaxID=3438738 RepID=UPI003F901794